MLQSPSAAIIFHKAATLRNRTFIALLIAQFLAAFNDQAIHASAMFFAINKKTLTEDQAISLMPILFFAPWAMFPTLAGYFADKYSKRRTLVFWKFAEIGITALALVGFVIGSELDFPNAGAWIVLSTVFMMGLHSTFFVPAKYGAMPEILHESLLSRGNGILESLSFLATILGTVSGGALSLVFHDDEYVIGAILTLLAIVGAGASLLIHEMPPAQPDRAFPRYLYAPLFENLAEIWRSRPLRFALVGIAFFTFMLIFMRQTVYMFGETRPRRLNEFETSAIVGMTALGIAFGSPLAGWLSGKKIELGLLPIGGLGMVFVLCLSAVFLDYWVGLIICITLIGFFTGFYLVPLFTLQQHRAPKKKKGEVIASFNFTNVVGAMLASVLFFMLVRAAHHSGFSPVLEQKDSAQPVTLKVFKVDRFHRPRFVYLESEPAVGHLIGKTENEQMEIWNLGAEEDTAPDDKVVIHMSQKAQIAWDRFEETTKPGGPNQPPAESSIQVKVSTYQLGAYTHYVIRLADEPLKTRYDNRHLPRYLFLGAGIMTLGVLVILLRLLPDLLQRTRWLMQSLHRPRLRVFGLDHLPDHGPVLLIADTVGSEAPTNTCWASDRQVHFVAATAGSNGLEQAVERLQRGGVVALQVGDAALEKLRARLTGIPLALVPVVAGGAEVRFGATLAADSTPEQIRAGLRAASEIIED